MNSQHFKTYLVTFAIAPHEHDPVANFGKPDHIGFVTKGINEAGAERIANARFERAFGRDFIECYQVKDVEVQS